MSEIEIKSVGGPVPVSSMTEVALDYDGFKAATKVYSQLEAFHRERDDIAIIFGIKSPIVPPDAPGIPILPHTACYMSIEHFKEFVALLNRQLERIEEDS